MKLSDLQFDYPANLVALYKEKQSRVLVANLFADEVEQHAEFQELQDVSELVQFFKAGDVLVLNNTRVLPRRLFTKDHFEILFLDKTSSSPEAEEWTVLCPSSQWPKGVELALPENVFVELTQRGRPQTLRVRRGTGAENNADGILSEAYFLRHADLPLPPYILKSRKEKRIREGDREDYQTQWAKVPGSLAAPTASLHFTKENIAAIEARGVKVLEMTLHVGLGTFLPITTSLEEHKMHSEFVSISSEVWLEIQKAKSRGGRIWALGTTVARALESASLKKIAQDSDGNFYGATDIFIKPGFEFQAVDCLLTNFHQPESTLLALVAAFADLELVKKAYALAIQNQFRLFSYGDLSAWIK